MTSAKIYDKRYLTKSRTKDDDNIYVLIFFKCDNTFTIKKKSNVHGIAENGLVTIKDRNKSYVGCCLFEGNLLIKNYYNTGNEYFFSNSYYLLV